MNLLAFLLVILTSPLHAGERINLALYQPIPGAAVWQEQQFTCRVDEGGRCEISGEVTPWPDGLLRGEVRAEAGARPVIWQGGRLELTLTAPQIQAAGEARYDTLDAGLAVPHKQVQQTKVAPALFLFGLAVFVLYGSYRLSQTHASVSALFAELEEKEKRRT